MAFLPPDPAVAWTAIDLVDRFGPMPLHRVLTEPVPGTATVEDVIRLDDHEDRLCELIDGILIEKVYGFYKSLLGVDLIAAISSSEGYRDAGIATGAGGTLQISPGQVRIPDLAFISYERLNRSDFRQNPVPLLAPDLVAEFVTCYHTKRELDRKLEDYFAAGVRLAWHIDLEESLVRVYTRADERTILRESDTLTGGTVLPGFELPLESYFSRRYEFHA
ncbi:MAG: Uma2 family endonuclease [Pirellulales bacterium]